MNERIKELIKNLHRECDEFVDSPFGGGGYVFNKDKFAKAIAQECLRVIYEEELLVGSDWRCSDGVHISNKIADLFGIET